MQWKYARASMLISAALLAGAVAAIAGFGAQVQAKPTSAAPIACWMLRWCVSAAPDADASPNILTAVAAVSPNDVWAVGASQETDQGGRLLGEHWNGRAWSLVPVPQNGGGPNGLTDIAALSSNNVWAVGAYYDGPNQYTLAEHWDGRSWEIIDSPSASPIGGSALNGLAAVSSNDIWAVGAYNTGGAFIDKTLTLHWDGTSWQIIDSPNAPGFNALYKVAAVSSSDVWAVGFSDTSQWVDRHPLSMHWNGRVWSIVRVPVVAGATDTVLNDVSFRQKNDGWAVGTYYKDGAYKSLALHWNGKEWRAVTSLNYSQQYNELRSVTVTKKGDVWAVGAYYADIARARRNGSGFRPQLAPSMAYDGIRTLVLHWTGSKWERYTSPSPGTGALLSDITSAAGSFWAVGSFNNHNGPNRTLVERFTAPSR